MVPIGSDPVGAIGAYWRDTHLASETEIGPLKRLAAAAAAALARIEGRPSQWARDDEPLLVA